MPLSAGDRLGPYEILAPIGEGGMGVVWKARDERLNRTVAIKQVASSARGRFQQEARAAAALNHPHICQIFDVGPDYLVMEYVEGASPRGPMPVEPALKLARQVAGALEAAHKRGILHRDLKPANILLNENGVKLLDFGLAKLLADADPDATKTADGMLLGTAAYMSPEQAKGKPADARSDIFSFGAVMYEALSGRQAFRGASILETLNAVVHAEPAPLHSPLASIVAKCLAKSPDDRYQSAEALLAALAQASSKVDTVSARRSIAVLPFANMSGDKEQEYFSDGLAEEILNLLAKAPDLKVIARTSSFAFRGKEQDITAIAQALRVGTVLEGSVRKAGLRIRVTAQLIDASDGSHLWSERYDRELTDVFEVQDEIAGAIAAALRTTLAPAPRAHVPKLAAYEELLKARHYLGKWNPDAAAKGQECLNRAIALDPSFAVARCELAWFLFAMVTENKVGPSVARDSMREHAREALRTDPALPEAHAVLGAAAVLDYDWREAGRNFDIAMAAETIQPSVRGFYSLFYLAPMGRMCEAQEQVDRLLKEDPLNLFFCNIAADYLLATGKSAEAEARQKQMLELDANYWLAYGWLGAQYLLEGRIGEAREMFGKAHFLAGWNPTMAGAYAGLLERSGDKARAAEIVASFGDGSAFGAAAGFIGYYAALPDRERAADWFEKAIDQRDTRCPWIFVHMFCEGIQSTPRWPAIARRMNLPGSA